MLTMTLHYIKVHNDQLGDWALDSKQALGHGGMQYVVGYGFNDDYHVNYDGHSSRYLSHGNYGGHSSYHG